MWTLQTNRIALPAEAGPGIRAWLHHLARFIERACQRSRQRRALARLDARLLRDIGVSVEQAEREAAKPFWRD